MEPGAGNGDVITQADIGFMQTLASIHGMIVDNDQRGWMIPGDMAGIFDGTQKEYSDLLAARIARGAAIERGKLRMEDYTRPDSHEKLVSKTEKGGWSMNKRVVWLWVAVIVAAGIFPPWERHGGYPAGYHLLFSPPLDRGAIQISQTRLFIEWLLATVVAAGFQFVGPRDTNRKISK